LEADQAEVHLLFVERLQDVDVLELQSAVVGGLAEVEAGAAGGLQLVDLLLVLREWRRGDLDAGRFLEIGDHRVRQFIVPVDQAQAARGRKRVGDDRGGGHGAEAERRRRLQERAAIDAGQ